MTNVIPCVRDTNGYLHAPHEGRSTVAICGIEGAYVDFPASYTGRWCSTCMTNCQNSEGERLWPVIETREGA